MDRAQVSLPWLKIKADGKGVREGADDSATHREHTHPLPWTHDATVQSRAHKIGSQGRGWSDF